MFDLGYIAESQIALLLLYGLYTGLLHHHLSPRLSRVFILSIIPLSMALPLVNLPLLPPLEMVMVAIPTIDYLPDMIVAQSASQSEFPWLAVFYSFGLAVALGILVVNLIRILSMLRRSRRERLFGHEVRVIDNSKSAYLFFNTIIIGSEVISSKDAQMMILHEESHRRLLHGVDNMIMLVFRSAMWFNPAIWHLWYSLREVHEWEADSEVIASGADANEYFNLLINAEMGICDGSPLANSFSYSSIKNRIIMTNKTTRTSGVGRLLCTIPVLMLIASLFCLSHRAEAEPAPADTVIYKSVKKKDVAAEKPDDKKESFDDDKKRMIESGAVLALDGKKEFLVLSSDSLASITVLKNEVADKEYNANGKSAVVLESKDYKANRDIIQVVFTPNEELPFIQVQTMPKFNGGDVSEFGKWCASNIRYPSEVFFERKQGRVVLSVIIEKDGSVSNVNVVQSPDEHLAAEAKRVVESSPLWTPGEQRGEKVRVKYDIPIDFKLD